MLIRLTPTTTEKVKKMKRSEKNGIEIFTLSARESADWERGDVVRDKARLKAVNYSRKYGVNVHIVNDSGRVVYAISPDMAGWRDE